MHIDSERERESERDRERERERERETIFDSAETTNATMIQVPAPDSTIYAILACTNGFCLLVFEYANVSKYI